jgi:hypothetical protein
MTHTERIKKLKDSAMHKGILVFENGIKMTLIVHYFNDDMQEIGRIYDNRFAVIFDEPYEWDQERIDCLQDEPNWYSCTFGTCPTDVIRARLNGKNYPMEIMGSEEVEMLARVVNQGIDSHLEAVTGDFGKVERKLPPSEMFPEGALIASGVKCDITPDGMLCLLRRLNEDGTEEADSLRGSILSTLNIEEI